MNGDMTEEKRKALIAALIRERDGYIRRGLEDRVASVDAELLRLGAEAAHPVRRANRRLA